MNDLAKRIALYLDDAPIDGRHSDAAGASAYQLLEEAMDSLAGLAQPPTASGDLRALFSDHYWDSFEGSKDIIMKHVDFVLSLAPNRSALIEECARVVERWSLPTIQTPSMWLVDKAGIAAEIRALALSSTDREAGK